jgi:hypothetical protein
MRYVDELAARDRWLLEQERAKTRMLLRHIQRLRLQRLIMSAPSSADAYRAYVGPTEERHARRVQHWGRVWSDVFATLYAPLPDAEPERRQKRARLTLTLERKR